MSIDTPTPAGQTALVRYEQSEADLVAAAKDAEGLTIAGPEDAAGYRKVHETRMRLVKLRTAIEKQRKGLNEDALDWQRRVNAEAKRLVALIEPAEQRLEIEQRRIDAERERIKAEAERVRREKLDGRVAALTALGLTPSVSALAEMPDAEFDELLATARAEHAARVAREQAEAAERERKAAEARAAEEAARKAEADRLAAEREALARQRAELEAAQRAERERLEAQAARLREEQRAAQAKLDEERRAFQAEQERVRQEQEAERARLAPPPVLAPEPVPAYTEAEPAGQAVARTDGLDDVDESEAIEAASRWLGTETTAADDRLREACNGEADWDMASFAAGYLAGVMAERKRKAGG